MRGGAVEQRVGADEASASDGASQLNPVFAGPHAEGRCWMWAVIFLGLAGPADAARAPQSVERLGHVRSLIAAHGTRDALSLLSSDDRQWDLLLDDVATGTPGWLKVAAEFLRISDAHASETLAMAVQEALPRNPVGVLELVAAQRFNLPDACGMYGFGQIEDERPVSLILALVDKRIKAVSLVKKSSLVPVRDECLVALKRLRARLPKQGAGQQPHEADAR
jgi:hypothetical protein